MAKRFVSGIRPADTLHLGHYFGALRSYLEQPDDSEAFYFVANYHALTRTRDAEQLRRQTHELAWSMLSLGLDPRRSRLFRQSDVPEVTELTWLLLTVTPSGLLERAVAFKSQREAKPAPSAGLYAYPALMAADILAYRAAVVPVGFDQRQHVEITREIARTFNHHYGEVFIIPELKLSEASVVPGADGLKMSEQNGNALSVFADTDEIARYVAGIKTDSLGIDDKKDPDTCTVFALYKLLASKQHSEEMAARYRAGGYAYKDAKHLLTETLAGHFAAARSRRSQITATEVEQTLRDGAAHARRVAQNTLIAARRACGVE